MGYGDPDIIDFPSPCGLSMVKHQHNQGDEHGKRIGRIYNKDGVEFYPQITEWQEYLRAIGGENIQKRVGEQGPKEKPGPKPKRLSQGPAGFGKQPSQQGCGQKRKKEGMGKSPVKIYIVGLFQKKAAYDIEIRDGPANGTPKQSLISDLFSRDYFRNGSS